MKFDSDIHRTLYRSNMVLCRDDLMLLLLSSWYEYMQWEYVAKYREYSGVYKMYFVRFDGRMYDTFVFLSLDYCQFKYESLTTSAFTDNTVYNYFYFKL